jgi:hypothetical protein
MTLFGLVNALSSSAVAGILCTVVVVVTVLVSAFTTYWSKTLINRTWIPIRAVHRGKYAMSAYRIASVGGTQIVVITGTRRVYAIPSVRITRVGRTLVTIIAVFSLKLTLSCNRITWIHSAQVAVITSLWSVDTTPVHALVSGARVFVIAIAVDIATCGCIDTSNTWDTRICGFWLAIITDHRLMGATTSRWFTNIYGAWVSIIAGHKLIVTTTGIGIAEAPGTWVSIITSLRVMDTNAS